MIVDQSGWGLLSVTGADRVRFVQGMCTGNVETLGEGEWVRAAMCNAKGKLVSVFDVVRRKDDLLLICEPQLAEPTMGALEKYAIVDDVAIERVTQPVYRLWSTPAAVWSAPPVLEPLPGPAASPEAVEIRRVEAGLPRFGVDITDNNFPFETPLSAVIDYNKGCYIGQEPIARVHHRGSPTKMLRGLIADQGEPMTVGARVSHAERDDAGEVTSAVVSPDFGSIALAYVRKIAWDPGTEVQVDGRPARVSTLPLGC